jgi:hypothetical protein
VARTPRAIEKACQTTTKACIRALQDPLPADEDPIIWPTPSLWADSQGQDGDEVFVTSLADTEAVGSARAIRDDLLQSMSSALPSMLALNVINHCIDLYMKYTFPTAPYVHEPTLRASANRFFAEPSDVRLFCTDSWREKAADMKAFTLLTATCASVASVVPESLLSYGQALAEPCLKASRAMLKAFEDFDIEHPSATSIITRALHSTALQQITGKSAVAYHVLGQATLLVQTMHLYREEALRSHDALEAQLLRNVFWQLYAADKASACLGSRPFILHELLFDDELTLRPSGETMVPLMDTAGAWYEETLQGKLLVGFHLIPRLWSSAASLLFDLKAYGRRNEDVAIKARLTQDYMVFIGILDGLPHWLQASNLIASSEDGEAARCQKTALWVQRCTIMVTYHCLRLVILQQCINSKAWEIMGLNGLALTLAMAKIGIIHDFVQTLDDIPFVYLQVKGEPTVSYDHDSMAGQLLTLTLGAEDSSGWQRTA